MHCLKYGLTTNNVLGIEMVTMDGEIVRIGGKHLDAPGFDILGIMSSVGFCRKSPMSGVCGLVAG